MKFNPCGAKCEMMRRTYRTRIKPFRDSDIEVGIRWYRTHDDAPTLPFPSFVTSRDWRQDFTTPTDLGEVWDAPREYYRGDPIPEARGTHICGTAEDFANGQVYNPSLPPTNYNANGLPVCCTGRIGEPGKVAIYPASTITAPVTKSGRPVVALYPSAVGFYPPYRRAGLTRYWRYPSALVTTSGPYLGRPEIWKYPDAGLTGYVTDAGVLNPGSDFCSIVTPNKIGVWYLQFINTPNQYGWGWILEPGTYCLQVRAPQTSAASDPVLYTGPTCGDRTEIVLATTQTGTGFPWTSYGTLVVPTDNYPNWWYRTFTLSEPAWLYLAITPDDLSAAYWTRLIKDVACNTPPFSPLPRIPPLP